MVEDLTTLGVEECFLRMSDGVATILNGDSGQFDDLLINKIVELIEQCKKLVDLEGLISKNEEIDDMQTSTIKVGEFHRCHWRS